MRYIAAILLLLLAGCGPTTPGAASVEAVEAINSGDTSGFARVTDPRQFDFPRDHGPHPEYQTEWWYYTGNLDSEDGRHFGFQLTFFRRALLPNPAERASQLATRNIYLAHLAIADVAGGQFHAYDRYSRDGGDLAGATGEPFRVWLENWSASAEGPAGTPMRLIATQADLALDLRLAAGKAPVLHGERGLSPKGSTPGNASYYYSLSRMPTNGSLRIGEQNYTVRGLSWMDHEFGTSFLEQGAVGWDWLGLQLDDGSDLMFFNLRRADGSTIYSDGTLVAPDGTLTRLGATSAQLEALATWRSPRTGAIYPARWRLSLPEQQLVLELTPYLADQELSVTISYWEGAVAIRATRAGQPINGSGYVELTGYTSSRSVGAR